MALRFSAWPPGAVEKYLEMVEVLTRRNTGLLTEADIRSLTRAVSVAELAEFDDAQVARFIALIAAGRVAPAPAPAATGNPQPAAEPSPSPPHNTPPRQSNGRPRSGAAATAHQRSDTPQDRRAPESADTSLYKRFAQSILLPGTAGTPVETRRIVVLGDPLAGNATLGSAVDKSPTYRPYNVIGSGITVHNFNGATGPFQLEIPGPSWPVKTLLIDEIPRIVVVSAPAGSQPAVESELSLAAAIGVPAAVGAVTVTDTATRTQIDATRTHLEGLLRRCGYPRSPTIVELPTQSPRTASPGWGPGMWRFIEALDTASARDTSRFTLQVSDPVVTKPGIMRTTARRQFGTSPTPGGLLRYTVPGAPDSVALILASTQPADFQLQMPSTHELYLRVGDSAKAQHISELVDAGECRRTRRLTGRLYVPTNSESSRAIPLHSGLHLVDFGGVTVTAQVSIAGDQLLLPGGNAQVRIRPTCTVAVTPGARFRILKTKSSLTPSDGYNTRGGAPVALGRITGIRPEHDDEW